MFYILSYEASTNKWLDPKGKECTPKIGDQIDVEMCEEGWKEAIEKLGFSLRFVAGITKVAKKG